MLFHIPDANIQMCPRASLLPSSCGHSFKYHMDKSCMFGLLSNKIFKWRILYSLFLVFPSHSSLMPIDKALELQDGNICEDLRGPHHISLFVSALNLNSNQYSDAAVLGLE